MIVVLVETEPSGAALVSLEALTFARKIALRSGDVPVHTPVG